jgi:hypothetical protein
MSKRQGLRHSRSTGKSSRVIENIAVGLFRWAATDHSGIGNALEHIPSMGYLHELKTIFMHFLISVAGAVLMGGWIFALFAYVIPNLIVWLL